MTASTAADPVVGCFCPPDTSWGLTQLKCQSDRPTSRHTPSPFPPLNCPFRRANTRFGRRAKLPIALNPSLSPGAASAEPVDFSRYEALGWIERAVWVYDFDRARVHWANPAALSKASRCGP